MARWLEAALFWLGDLIISITLRIADAIQLVPDTIFQRPEVQPEPLSLEVEQPLTMLQVRQLFANPGEVDLPEVRFTNEGGLQERSTWLNDYT